MDDLEFSIDHIIISGQGVTPLQAGSPVGAGQFQALLEAELQRILEQRYGLADVPVWRGMTQLDLPPIDLDDPSRTEDLIAALARRLAQALGAANAVGSK